MAHGVIGYESQNSAVRNSGRRGEVRFAAPSGPATEAGSACAG